MTGQDFVLSVLGPIAGFIAFMAIPLLGLAMLRMIGSSDR